MTCGCGVGLLLPVQIECVRFDWSLRFAMGAAMDGRPSWLLAS